MGKKQHSKDRLFITRTEWNTEWGGYKQKQITKTQLPFYCCALSLQPFNHPYCTVDGYIFDLTAIFPYVKKYKEHPITGEKLSLKDVIKLNFHKNEDNEFHCPITYRVFNDSAHIVAIKTTGNVYAYEAVEELNLKNEHYFDLIKSDVAFDPKKDIIEIQNPNNPQKQFIENFAHIKQKKDIPDVDDIDDEKKSNVRHNVATKSIMNEINNSKIGFVDKHKELNLHVIKEPPLKKIKTLHDNNNNNNNVNNNNEEQNKEKKYEMRNVYTSGRMAASFTSTIVEPVFHDELTIMTEQQIREERWRSVKGNGKKAFVRLITNLGNLNFQLDCDYVPMTCYNFLKHCENGYYNNCLFHRNIVSFMIQGGDPTGTGYGGTCAWKNDDEEEVINKKAKKQVFKDEFHKLLKHDDRGILSMANSGPNTNGSQFFILYGPQPHLDGLHSVFGKLVGGMEVLNKMEMVPCDNNDKPKQDIIITGTIVYQNPFNDPLPFELKKQKEEKEKEIKKLESEKGLWWSQPMIINDNKNRNNVGKYINFNLQTNDKTVENDNNANKNKLHLPKPKTNNDSFSNKQNNSNSIFRFKQFENLKK